MYTIKALSIKRKLILIMMATSLITIVLMAPLIIINQAINSQHAIQQQLITLADVLGSRSTGALTFDDSATGEEILNALALKSNITSAVIERSNGDPFAVFGKHITRKTAFELNTKLGTEHVVNLWTNLVSNTIHVARDIYLEDDRIGKIRIVSTLDELRADLLNYTILITVISFVCFTITFIICTRLQKIVSSPIVSLKQTMDTISREKDYSLRVKNNEENELGVLIDGFNNMLEQIQLRDIKLAQYSSHLEKTVETRTMQLTDANKKRIIWLETMARFLRHELKNSSVGIKTSLDLIERRTSSEGKIDTYLNRARKSMSNMNALLQSAGDASNLEASLYKEKLEPINLSATVRAHMETYSAIYPDAEIIGKLQTEIFVLGNASRLNQLLDKLVSNAVEHSIYRTPIEVCVKRENEVAKLIVKNQGDALPKNINAIFDQFVSLRSPERKTDENFGLGLYIVKLIAESHGGYVEAHDLVETTGAMFKVTIPIVNNNSEKI